MEILLIGIYGMIGVIVCASALLVHLKMKKKRTSAQPTPANTDTEPKP